MLRRMTLALALAASTVFAPAGRTAQAGSPAGASNQITPGAARAVRPGVFISTRIHDIQGAQHRSPLVGQSVQAVYGIVTAVDHPGATNEDFNLSTAVGTTVADLAQEIWTKVNGDRPLSLVHDPAFEHDVQKRVPCVDKANQVLGFEAKTSLSDMLDETIPWIRSAVESGIL